MSASHWAICPRCKARRQRKADAAADEARAAYGKVSVQEFDEMRTRVDELRAMDDEVDCNFREDYEIYGAEEGMVIVDYSGECRFCGLKLTFRHEHPLPVAED